MAILGRIGTAAAIGTLTAGIMLLTGLPGARADELADLRANQQLLQQRLDQLEQTAQVGLAKPQERPGTPSLAGTFPRSILIPGTDTSLLVGGFVEFHTLYEISGGTPNGQESTPNNGAGGFVQSVPLNLAGQHFGTTVLGAPNFNPHSRGSNILQMAARNSRLRVETRTPTEWGEAGTVWEMDFYGCSSGGLDCNNLNHSTNAQIPRLRLAYGTLGGFIAGQNTVPVTDNGAAAELLDFGGSFGVFGYARAPYVGYKMSVPWIPGTSFGFYAVDPDTEVFTPVGAFETDSALPGILGIPQLNQATPTISGTPGPTNIGVNIAKSTLPDANFVLRFDQPWGHLQLAAIVQKLEIQDGKFVSQEFLGYGGAFTGNVHPAWFGWVKDNLGFGAFAGSGLGRYGGGSGGGSNPFTNALATNYGLVGVACNQNTGVGCYGNDPAATTTVNAGLVRAATVTEFGGNVNYQHWWTPTLRSTADFGIAHQDIPIDLVLTNATTAGYNKELLAAHANLIWSPVAFIDTGVEYTFGHRVTLANTKGDDNTVAYTFRVRF